MDAWEQRNQQTDEMWKKHLDFYRISGGLILFVGGLWLGSRLFGVSEAVLEDNELAYWTNVFTESLGVVFTIVVLGAWNTRQNKKDLQKRLVREAGSRDNSTAVSAVDWMREEGWLTGLEKLLSEKTFKNANLQNADFSGADLTKTGFVQCNCQNANFDNTNLEKGGFVGGRANGARFSGANLIGVRFSGTFFREARFINANMAGAVFERAELSGAYMYNANLEGSHIDGATSLKGAILYGANLANVEFPMYVHINWAKHMVRQRANREGILSKSELFESDYTAIFDETTMLPDGSYWKPEFGIKHFIDSTLENFWEGYQIGEKLKTRQDFKKANLQGAELSDLDFSNCNLEHADLSHAKMRGTIFNNTIMRYTKFAVGPGEAHSMIFTEADLTGVVFSGLHLQFLRFPKAILHKCDFSNCQLHGVDFRGADLTEASLVNSNLGDGEILDLEDQTQFSLDEYATNKLDRHTILPDGTNYDPQDGAEQLSRFTDPDHPEFWQPEWGKEQSTENR